MKADYQTGVAKGVVCLSLRWTLTASDFAGASAVTSGWKELVSGEWRRLLDEHIAALRGMGNRWGWPIGREWAGAASVGAPLILGN